MAQNAAVVRARHRPGIVASQMPTLRGLTRRGAGCAAAGGPRTGNPNHPPTPDAATR